MNTSVLKLKKRLNIKVINNSRVAISSTKQEINYPVDAPYNPGEEYPELCNCDISKKKNDVYPLFRKTLFLLGLDKENYGSEKWNPFGDIIKPGQNVLIKPNFVRHMHMNGGDLNAVITHGSVIRCALDYVALALKGDGSITVGDAPVQSAEFEKIVDHVHLKEICESIKQNWGMVANIVDFRLASIRLDEDHVVLEENSLVGDSNGYCTVDLGNHSLLSEIGTDSSKFRVTSYNCDELKNHHNEKINEYLIPNAVLNSDVVINLPKLKTHRKVGLTAALKNLVGINGFKDWLPHHRCGSIANGGDEYLNPSILKRTRTLMTECIDSNLHSNLNPIMNIGIRVINKILKTFEKNQYEEGSWYGNDTLWRTVLDLNRLLSYSDKNGAICVKPQRHVFTIVDGIIAGEGEGPMEPDSINCCTLIGGFNSVAVDSVIASFIGFDYNKIPLIKNAFKIVNYNFDDVLIVINNDREINLKELSLKNLFNFKPSRGWVGYIEK